MEHGPRKIEKIALEDAQKKKQLECWSPQYQRWSSQN